jgi:hypothetical protein
MQHSVDTDRQLVRLMDICARVWSYLGSVFGVRPATIISLLVGSILFAAGLTYTLVQQSESRRAIRQVQAAFCNGQDVNPSPRQIKLCQDLLAQLLKNPRPVEVTRLKKLISENR